MKRFVQLITAGVALLFLGTSALLAQEATFGAGPAVPAGNGANGGFAWGDVNGDGNLDVFTPSTTVTLNNAYIVRCGRIHNDGEHLEQYQRYRRVVRRFQW